MGGVAVLVGLEALHSGLDHIKGRVAKDRDSTGNGTKYWHYYFVIVVVVVVTVVLMSIFQPISSTIPLVVPFHERLKDEESNCLVGALFEKRRRHSLIAAA